MTSLRLDGIDGQHLWGFMTALGVLWLLDQEARVESLPPPRLAFEEDGTAVVYSSAVRHKLAAVLLARLRTLQPFLEADLASVKKPSDFERSSYENIALRNPKSILNFLAGLACVVRDDAAESTLCAANGASHQDLIQSMRDILNLVEEEHVRVALFEPWQKAYRVPDGKRRQFRLGARKPTLRLDPADERLYALRFSNPTTTNDYCTELGAQALAIPAFAMLPVVPSKRPVTIGSRRQRHRVTFSWALWNIPATLPAARTLVWSGVGHPRVERQRGVFAAFSADRVSGTKGKLSFSPPQGVW